MESEIIRFWSKVEIDTASGCWIWTGTKDEKGYGRFHLRVQSGKQKHIRAHVYSYRFLGGAPVSGMELHHKCTNKQCVNPQHLKYLSKAEHAITKMKLFCLRGHSAWVERNKKNGKKARACLLCERLRSTPVWRNRNKTTT